jgi:Protein of unknown function (DUF2628)
MKERPNSRASPVPSFAVYQPPNPPADRLDRATGLLFLKDAFSWAAALFAPLWMLAHRLWWLLFGYLAVLGLVLAAGLALALQPHWVVLGVLVLHLAVGLEAAPLRMWSLARRGWKSLGAVTGKSLAECERRFIAAWLPTQPMVDLASPPTERIHTPLWSALNPFSLRT